MKVYFQSLGCPKNLVDSEVMLGLLAQAGAEFVLDPAAADVCVVNTCAFVEAAKKESIDAILELGRHKELDPGKKIVVTGCLAQRYGPELAGLLPEVDAFLGTGDFPRLTDLLEGRYPNLPSRYGRPAHFLPDLGLPRLRTGPFFSAYLKVSEGCNRRCSFCIIPKIRGRQRSRPLDSILEEAERLAADGVVEVNLVAQDLTAYGRDLREGVGLARLVRELARVEGIAWIRLLYLYPSAIDTELLRAIAEEPRVCPYVDVPLQHASDRVLRRMRREKSGAALRRLVARIRNEIPGVAIRTTFLVGFPGETEEDFEILLDFVREARFDRLGVFPYSAEEGTEAASFPDQVPKKVARARLRRLVEEQARISAEQNAAMVGSAVTVLVCGEDERGRLYGRLATQAPEVDGVVYLRGTARPGSFVRARIDRASTYDLWARVEDRVDTGAPAL
ncbi:MAG: ribosomal protein S12 methylthiotransferase RimO [Candidatus Binatia bacterium]|nr:MAG: ribosomal protein S12 methylthiotransferase RimO [Candidatus Binatia bacterium]